VITDEKIYNLKKTKVKRAILISKLGGITKTLLNGKPEFVVHIPSEYDYRFISERREEILDILKIRFMEKMHQNLPIYGVSKPKLSEFTTTEKDMKRGVSKFPPI